MIESLLCSPDGGQSTQRKSMDWSYTWTTHIHSVFTVTGNTYRHVTPNMLHGYTRTPPYSSQQCNSNTDSYVLWLWLSSEVSGRGDYNIRIFCNANISGTFVGDNEVELWFFILNMDNCSVLAVSAHMHSIVILSTGLAKLQSLELLHLRRYRIRAGMGAWCDPTWK